MARMLFHLSELTDLRLCALSGGNLDNVIPKSCTAKIAVKSADAENVLSLIEEYKTIYKNEFATADPDVCIEYKRGEKAEAVVKSKDTHRMLTALYTVPYHVQEMSADIKGLVQTSLNLGVLNLFENELSFSFAVRSSVTSQKEELVRRIRAVVEYMGGEVTCHGDYPAWQYAKVSPLRDTVLEAYKAVSGKDGEIMAIHAGLECGLFIEKMEGLDCISFGPDLCDVHSPREKMNVSSIERTTNLVYEILKRCK